MSWPQIVALQIGLTACAAGLVFLLLRSTLRSRSLEEGATLRAVAFTSSTVASLRQGLSARTALRVLRSLVPQARVSAAAIYDGRGLMGFHPASEGRADGHQRHLLGEREAVLAAMHSGRPQLLSLQRPEHPASCPLQLAVVAPLVVDDLAVAALVTYHAAAPSPAAVRLTGDLAELLATQLRLQRADQQREAMVRSELRALRAQISPHFIYNTLTTISSFIRTDPERARELLGEFADFSRRAFRGPTREFTTLSDELVLVDQYLTFERARFGERLSVRYHIEPEVLGTPVPALLIQPLVENAVKHGIESRQGRGEIVIEARARESECLISVRDDGRGFSVPEELGPESGALGNINRRLEGLFGPAHKLEIDSAEGRGTEIRVRIPRRASRLRAS